MPNANCFICGSTIPQGTQAPTKPDTYTFKCLRCGEYSATGQAIHTKAGLAISSREKCNASSWLRENEGFSIDSKDIPTLFSKRSPSIHDRCNKILTEIEKKSYQIGDTLEVNTEDPYWLSLSWSISNREFYQLIKHLTSLGMIKSELSGSVVYVSITPEGLIHLDGLRQINSESQQGFVAMWFEPSMKPVYDYSISLAISDAGYSPHRVDQGEYAGRIDDEIILQIRKSKFLVADLTGLRGGVYYEAGFARGLGLTVFFTCRKEYLDQLHFDIRQYNCIDWEIDKLQEFRSKLAKRIEAELGKGKASVI